MWPATRTAAFGLLALAACNGSGAPETASDPVDGEPPSWPEGAVVVVRSLGPYHAVLEWDPAVDDVGPVRYQVSHDGGRFICDRAGATVTALQRGSDTAVTITAIDGAGNRSVTSLVTNISLGSACVRPFVQVPAGVASGARP